MRPPVCVFVQACAHGFARCDFHASRIIFTSAHAKLYNDFCARMRQSVQHGLFDRYAYIICVCERANLKWKREGYERVGYIARTFNLTLSS